MPLALINIYLFFKNTYVFFETHRHIEHIALDVFFFLRDTAISNVKYLREFGGFTHLVYVA